MPFPIYIEDMDRGQIFVATSADENESPLVFKVVEDQYGKRYAENSGFIIPLHELQKLNNAIVTLLDDCKINYADKKEYRLKIRTLAEEEFKEEIKKDETKEDIVDILREE